MDYRILGPVQVLRDGEPVALGGAKQRALLAILLLDANAVVAADRLIDELWGDAPPATAAKSVQVYVSRLRKALGGREAPLVTRDPGYLLRVAPGELDAQRFERLLDDGRQALEEGEHALAAERLREALGLWRGAPLADLTYEPFAQAEIARLDELRLDALEARAEADLAIGDDGALIGELERLVSAHPLREGFRALLMLALYRCGRQADALEVFADARRRLVGELGIEPGRRLRELQRQILEQDAALERPPRRRAPPSGSSPRQLTRHPLVAGALAGALAVAVGIPIFALGRDDQPQPRPARITPNTVAAIDTGSGALRSTVGVGAGPGALAVGAGDVWVANRDDRTVSHVDAAAGALRHTIPLVAAPEDVAVGFDAVWVVLDHGGLVRIDPRQDRIDRVSALDDELWDFKGVHHGVAVGMGSVWVEHPGGRVERVDPATGKVVATIDVGTGTSGIAVGAGAVWVTNAGDGTVTRIDPTNAVVATIPVGRTPSAVAVGAGAIWVTDETQGTLLRIDARTNAISATIPVGPRPRAVAAGSDAVLVTGDVDRLVHVDPATNRALPGVHLGAATEGVALQGRRAWVSAGRVPEAVAARTGGRARFTLAAESPSLDPASGPTPVTAPIFYATCALLYNHPDRTGQEGAATVPEVASGPPRLSADGDTYTIRLRAGFRFSPPSRAPVTARAFARAIERGFAPSSGSPAAGLLPGLAGGDAYLAGRARHLAGVRARADTLTLRVTRPIPDLTSRLATFIFCAVPPDTPEDPGSQPIPMAGPYYVAEHVPDRHLVLRRNPSYHGGRPRRLQQIDIDIGVPLDRAVRLIEMGRADHAADGLPPGPNTALVRRYGPGSAAASRGRQQYFTGPAMGVRFLVLNAARAPFADRRVRRAVAYAIDRRALLAQQRRFVSGGAFYGGEPTDDYLPPSVPGYANADLYPLEGPDLRVARRLARHAHGTVVLATSKDPPNPQQAQILKENLSAAGLRVKVRAYARPVLLSKVLPDTHAWDLLALGWFADYTDPSTFIDGLLTPDGGFAHFDDPYWQRRITAASRLSGPARLQAYAKLSVQLARRESPLVAFGVDTLRGFFSARLGCQLFHPVWGFDWGALCVRPSG